MAWTFMEAGINQTRKAQGLPRIAYGNVKPEGANWVYQGTAINPTHNPNVGFSTTGSWTQQAPAPAPAAAPAAAPVAAAPAAAAPAAAPASTPAPPPPPQQKSAADALAASIAAMQAGFQDQLKQQTAQFAAMQQAQEERMLTLQEQMKQSAAAAAARPTVAGVKTATSSAGTDMQIARRGTTGGFSRAGMRIQSLNV